MAELTPEIAAVVAQACRTGADEAAQALSRALDTPLKLAVGDPQTFSPAELPGELAGPGLAVVLGVGPAAALLTVPESTGLVPDWASHPDPTGKSKLSTLAQELGMSLLPEEFLVEQFDTLYLGNLAEAVRRAGPSGSLAVVPLELTKEDGSRAEIWLLWPVSEPRALAADTQEARTQDADTEDARTQDAATQERSTPEPGAQQTHPAAATARQAERLATASADSEAAPKKRPGVARPGTKTAAAPFGTPGRPRPTSAAGRDRAAGEVKSADELPAYARSLLHIELPVMVTLAQKRQPLARIMELVPGSIIQFDKSCEDPLCLEVAGRPLALGEAVKVGEKFGLRITAMIMPGERFRPLGPAKRPQ